MSDDDEQWDGELIPPDDSEAFEMPLDDGFELLLTLEDESLFDRASRLGMVPEGVATSASVAGVAVACAPQTSLLWSDVFRRARREAKLDEAIAIAFDGTTDATGLAAQVDWVRWTGVVKLIQLDQIDVEWTFEESVEGCKPIQITSSLPNRSLRVWSMTLGQGGRDEEQGDMPRADPEASRKRDRELFSSLYGMMEAPEGILTPKGSILVRDDEDAAISARFFELQENGGEGQAPTGTPCGGPGKGLPLSTAQWDRITRMAPCTPDQVAPSQEQPIMATPVCCSCNKKPGVQGRHKKNCAISQATSTRYPRREQEWVGTSHLPTPQPIGTPCSFPEPVTATISFTLRDVALLVLPQPLALSPANMRLFNTVITHAFEQTDCWIRVFLITKLCLSRTLKGDLHEATRRKLILFRGGRHMQQLYEEALLLHHEWENCRKRDASTSTLPSTTLQQAGECKRWYDSDAEPVHHTQLSVATLRNAIIRVKHGLLSRATQSLEKKATVQPTPDAQDKMQALFNADTQEYAIEETEEKASQQQAHPMPISALEVQAALKKTQRGAAGGCSGLTPDLIKTAGSLPGSDLYDVIAQAFNKKRSQLRKDEKAFFFTMRAAGLGKKDGGIRPLAVGETLRRLLSKIQLTRLGDKPREILQRMQQYGVGVKNGIDAAWFTAKMLIDEMADGDIGMKMDLSNAFNAVEHAWILRCVETTFPEILEDVRESLDNTYYSFGDRLMRGRKGLSQGDPLSPFLFCLAIVCFEVEVKEKTQGTTNNLWYIDDGLVVGNRQAVHSYFQAFKELGPAKGFHLNLAKCEVICKESDTYAYSFAGQKLTKVWSTDWEYLGSNCGNRQAVERAVTKNCEALLQRARLICQLNRRTDGMHVAFLLIRSSVAMATTFAARRHGPLEAFIAFDQQLLHLINSEFFGMNLTPSAIEQLGIPVRYGGLGIRPTWPFSAAAHVGCISQLATQFEAIRFPTSYQTALELLSDEQSQSQSKTQKALSIILMDERVKFWKSGLSQRHTAIVTSATASSANLFITRPHIWANKLFLNNGQFSVLLRFRCEIPIAKCPFRCPKCGAQADIYGDHLLRCMTGGDKGALHAEICKAAFDAASSLLLRPRTEEHPFSQWGLRCDVSIAAEHVGNATHIDFACTHVIQESVVTMQHAIAAAGGAATAYETIKRAKYAEHARDIHFVPMVVDTMGAWGASSLPVFALLSKLWKQRYAETQGIVYARLTAPVMYRTANMLLQAAVPEEEMPTLRGVEEDM